jgi:hypothetical protein
MKSFAAILGVLVLSHGISSGAGSESGAKAKPAEKGKKVESTPPPTRAPFAEVRRLGDLVGTWKITGQMQKSPMGPGGKTDGTETCAWFEGEYFVVCRTSGTAPMGKTASMSTFGWDAEHKTYTYQSIDNFGRASAAKGKLDGNTWTWSNDEMMGGKKMKSRFVLVQESPDRRRMSWSISPDGQTWSELFSGDETREKSPAHEKAPKKKKKAK